MDIQSILLDLFKMSPLLLSEFIAIYKVTGYFLDNRRLYNEVKPVSIDKILRPSNSNIIEEDLDLSRLENEEIFSQIESFYNFMINNFSSNDLFIFYNNLFSLKVNYQDYHNGNSRINIGGSYDVAKNIINVTDISTDNVIYHELFHMASSISSKYSGFCQNSDYASIGTGINEGYTECLNERYFGGVNNAYPFEKYVMFKLEQVVGKDKMEYLYLNADLYGLINELGNYIEIDNVMKFIANMDFINKHLSFDKLKKVESKIIKRSLREVSYFLLDICSNKLLLLLNMDLISIDEFKDCLSYYFDSMIVYENFSDMEYDVLTDEEIDDYYDDALKKAERVVSDKENVKVLTR